VVFGNYKHWFCTPVKFLWKVMSLLWLQLFLHSLFIYCWAALEHCDTSLYGILSHWINALSVVQVLFYGYVSPMCHHCSVARALDSVQRLCYRTTVPFVCNLYEHDYFLIVLLLIYWLISSTCLIYGCVIWGSDKFWDAFLSASLYVSKRGAYWDRLCRDVVGRWLVGRLSRTCTVAKWCILVL